MRIPVSTAFFLAISALVAPEAMAQAPAATPAQQASPQQQSTKAPVRRVPGPGVRAYKEVRGLRNAAGRDPYTKPIVGRVRDERVRTIDSKGVAPNRRAERSSWVPLGADPELRRATVATVLRKIGQKSESLQKKLQGAKPEDAVWDVVLVGAGVHTAIVANTLGSLEDGDAPTMLTIEGDNLVAGNFRKLGSTVARNSANRAGRDGQAVVRGFGDKNPSSGPWSDPDLSGSEYPEVGILADTATVNLFASGSDFLMRSRVDKIEERGKNGQGGDWPARYRVTTSRGATVYTNTVIVGTGLGKAKLPQLSPTAISTVEAERAKFDLKNPDNVPKILTYEEALTLANLSKTGRDPYRAAAKQLRAPEVRGLRVKTNPPARLEGLTPNGQGQALDVPLEEVADFQFDPAVQRWKVTLASGKVVETEILNTRADSYRVPINPNENLASHADRLSNTSIGQGSFRVAIKPVRITVAPGGARNARVTKLGALTNNGAFFAYIRQAVDGKGDGDLGAASDVYRQDGNWVVKLANGQVRSGARVLLRPTTQTNFQEVQPDPAYELTADELALEPAPRPVVAVIGGGDSGRTFLEYLYGQAPEAAYQGGGKHDTAQRGDVGDVVWVVGDNGPKDCAQYLQNTRSRYLRLAGKFRQDGQSPSRAALVQANLQDLAQTADGKYQLSYANGRTAIVDRVIFATGYENKVSDLVGANLEPVKGTVPSLAGERIIAKRATGQDIFVVGPAAGGDVVGSDEVFSTKENVASLYAFQPRDVAIAKQVAQQGVRAPRTAAPAGRTPRIVLGKGTGAKPVPLETGLDESMIFVPRTTLKPMLIKAEMEDALRELRAPGVASLTISIARAGQQVTVSVPELDDAATAQVRDAIQANPLLVREISEHLQANKRLEIKAPLRASKKAENDGIVRAGAIQVGY